MRKARCNLSLADRFKGECTAESHCPDLRALIPALLACAVLFQVERFSGFCGLVILVLRSLSARYSRMKQLAVLNLLFNALPLPGWMGYFSGDLWGGMPRVAGIPAPLFWTPFAFALICLLTVLIARVFSGPSRAPAILSYFGILALALVIRDHIGFFGNVFLRTAGNQAVFLGYFLLKSHREGTSWQSVFMHSRPFFAPRSTIVPLPFGWEFHAPTADRLRSASRQALVLSLALWGMSLLLSWLLKQAPHSEIVRLSWGYGDLAGAGLAANKAISLALQERWAVCILKYCIHIFLFFVMNGTPAALATLYGFSMAWPVQNFLQSRSVLDFFSRFNVYYAQAVTDLFILPFFSSLGAIRNRKRRFAAALFPAILVFGTLRHAHLLVILPNVYPRNDIWERIVSAIPYWGFLGAILSLSVWFPARNRSRIGTLLFSAICFVCGAVLYTFVRDFEYGDFSFLERLYFVFSLFGIR